jgi:hypothetical protein
MLEGKDLVVWVMRAIIDDYRRGIFGSQFRQKGRVRLRSNRHLYATLGVLPAPIGYVDTNDRGFREVGIPNSQRRSPVDPDLD